MRALLTLVVGTIIVIALFLRRRARSSRWKRSRHCPRCNMEIPEFPELSDEQRIALRHAIDSGGAIAAIKRLREIVGCDLATANLWVFHRGIAGGGHEPLAPCPYCGQPLRSAAAKQCRFCKRDWHSG